MSATTNQPDTETVALLDRLASGAAVQSNCMFQLALMLARIAIEPCAEAYKDETAQAMMGLIRTKPKSNVVRLFKTSINPVDATPNKLSIVHTSEGCIPQVELG